MTENQTEISQSENNQPKISWYQVLISVMRAFIGIQTEESRLHDFSHYKNPWPFIIIGLILFLIFTACIIWVARIVVY